MDESFFSGSRSTTLVIGRAANLSIFPPASATESYLDSDISQSYATCLVQNHKSAGCVKAMESKEICGKRGKLKPQRTQGTQSRRDGGVITSWSRVNPWLALKHERAAWV